jgi:hypothetical protein
MPPTDYSPATAGVLATPYAWHKLRAVVRNWKLRNEKDVVEGHRVLGLKKDC